MLSSTVRLRDGVYIESVRVDLLDPLKRVLDAGEVVFGGEGEEAEGGLLRVWRWGFVDGMVVVWSCFVNILLTI